MTVACVEITQPGCHAELQDWFDAHSTITIKHIELIGNFCYIFYE